MKDSPIQNAPTDLLAPSQWLDLTVANLTQVPERRLLVAVLIDAVRCLQTGGDRERDEVIAWIRAGYGPARLSFGTMCEVLGLEAQPLARRLLATSADAPPLRRVRRSGARRATKIVPASRKHAHPVDPSLPTVAKSVPTTA